MGCNREREARAEAEAKARGKRAGCNTRRLSKRLAAKSNNGLWLYCKRGPT